MNSYFDKLVRNRVFLLSGGILFLGSVIIFLFTDWFYDSIEIGSVWVRHYFGKFYLYLGLSCVIVLLFLAFSSFGKIRLGNSPPEFDRLSWIAMLYSAGMGAGILLRAVQEPVFMYLNPPINTGSKAEIVALEYTFYQWGFTAWAFYGVFAVMIGYSIFIKKKDVRLSSGFSNFSKSKIIPEGIDILTIVTTVIGLVAAVGLGTSQIEGGASHLLQRTPGSLILNLALVFIICLLAFFSAWNGIQKGIKVISNWNVYITLVLMLFVFSLGDIGKILLNFCTAAYHYLIDFIPMSLAIGKYDPGAAFLTDWTYYYWAFWLAWAPFTGIFIARISKGRTLREMILGVLILPSLGTFLWFSVFGTSAFEIVDNFATYNDEFGNVFTSIFVFFENFPLQGFISILVMLLLVSFLVTSVDSAIFVLSMFTDYGKQEPRKVFRLAWAIIILVFSEAIIILGQVKPNSNVLTAMQKFLIITSLPFAFLTMLILVLLLLKVFQKKV